MRSPRAGSDASSFAPSRTASMSSSVAPRRSRSSAACGVKWTSFNRSRLGIGFQFSGVDGDLDRTAALDTLFQLVKRKAAALAQLLESTLQARALFGAAHQLLRCLLYTSPSPRDRQKSR